MNKIDIKFFSKYVPQGNEIIYVVHSHPVSIISKLLVRVFFLVLIPFVLYYNSLRIQDLVPFMFIEIYFICVYFKLLYDIFNWYYDVWIITNTGVIWLVRSFLKSESDLVNYSSIEGIGIEASGVLDKIFSKGDLILHKIGDDSFVLKNAYKPYGAVDLIEKLNIEAGNHPQNERFDVIMDALSGVVGQYLDKERERGQYTKEEEDKIADTLDIPGTIDLR